MFSRPDDWPLLEAEDYLVLGVAVGLPWAFGGVRIEMYRSAAFLLVAAAAIAVIKRGWAGLSPGRGGVAWLAPALLLLGWSALQTVPLPAALLAAVSPRAQQIYADALVSDASPGSGTLATYEQRALAALPWKTGAEAPQESAETGAPVATPTCLTESYRTISLEPSVTRERAYWFLALLLGFLLVRSRVEDAGRYVAYRAGLLGFFAVLAVFGIIQNMTADDSIYWYLWLDTDMIPFGPYVNPNHFGGVMELAAPALIGYALGLFRDQGRAALYRAPFLLSAVSGAACVVAAIAAAGKSAIVLIGISLMLLGLATARSRRTRLTVFAAALGLVVIVAIVASSTAIGERFNSFLQRSSEGHMLEGRAAVWSSSVEMLREFPWTGSGIGSFAEVHPHYMPPGSEARWNTTHNDYLELLLGGGVVAAVLLLWLMLGYSMRVVSVTRRRGPTLAQLGLVLGLISLSLHAFVDFNHQIPANALLFVCIAALALVGEPDEPIEAGE